MSEDGSEDAPRQPKRKIKLLLMSSSSNSDSDESVVPARKRKRRLRVMSDGSSSSGSSVVCAGSRRKRLIPLRDGSDAESDSSGWATYRSDAPQPVASTSKPTLGFASDSSEGNSDKCSICLLRFTTQEVGTPETCEHIFCLDCITEWSKNVNTCPVDRMTFDSIIVRSSAGGRVLRTEPVKVMDRRSSVDILLFENVTACEICGRMDEEERMLLCDACDLGFHMQCLVPPLTEVPLDHWFCPSCDGRETIQDVIYLSEVNDLFSDIMDIELPSSSRHVARVQNRNVTRSSRVQERNEPSTSNGYSGSSSNTNLPSTSQGSTTSRTNSRTSSRITQQTSTSRRRATTTRRKYKRRRTKTVIVEYEVKGNGKFPINKKVKRRVKKRKIGKRQPRTAARRTHVRASVRAILTSMGDAQSSTFGVQDLSIRRQRAGIPSLSLHGNPNQLEYFSDNEYDIGGASVAVSSRPTTSNILSAIRQARRKNIIAIPSPPHTSTAPDVLSDILESQTLLHSKKSKISISGGGKVDIKLETPKEKPRGKDLDDRKKEEEKIDLSKVDEGVKKVPSYPGQSRGGGWGGGYRGNYHREQGTNNNNFNNRGGNYDNSNYGGAYQGRQGNGYNQHNARRDEPDSYGNYARRPHQYSLNDDHFDRSRRSQDTNRGFNYNNSQRNEQGRHNLMPSWQPYGGAPPSRQEIPPLHARHSFGGFENPLDMRVGQTTAHSAINNNPADLYTGMDAPRQGMSQLQAFQPLPEPPVFKFDKTPEVEKSEDERSDEGLIIDTEKYDPTEPTHDDDSGDDDRAASATPPPILPPPLPTPAIVQNIIAGIDTSTINVPPNVLDTAVRQVLEEHRNLIAPSTIQYSNDKSDEDSDGDCPNFSIYSATSVHIANSTESTTASKVQKEPLGDSLEDLVQEDDEPTPEDASPEIQAIEKIIKATEITNKTHKATFDNSLKNEKTKTEKDEEYKEKVSKRCPITPNTRNPIKIKLNTPSLIKRHVSLYDEDDASEEAETTDKTEPTQTSADDTTAKDENIPEKSNESTEEKILDTEDEALDEDQKINSQDEERPPDIQKETEHDADNNLDKLDNVETPPLSPKNDTPSPSRADVDSNISNDHFTENKNELEMVKTPEPSDKMQNDTNSDGDNDDISDNDLDLHSQSSKKESVDRCEETLEKMTESISETEDERSYTPCLDENKSKDTSLETEKEKGIEGLDTEMISEEEGNEMFLDDDKPVSDHSHASPPPAPLPPAVGEEGEILDKRKSEERDDTKKKKKKDSKKDAKSKGKTKKGDVAFKKLSRSGKERNYRERDKEEKSKSKKERRDSSDTNDKEKQKQKRKEKRKDLVRYDVRTVVSEKRKKQKDAFGRDISPQARSPSPTGSPRELSMNRRSPSLPRGRKSMTPIRRSPIRRSPLRRSLSRGRISPLRARRSTPRRRPLSGTPPSSRGASPPLRRLRRSLTPRSASPPSSPRRRPRSRKRRKSASPRRGTPSRGRRASPRRRRSTSRGKKRVRRSPSRSPKPKATKKKKRARSERPASRVHRRDSPRRKSPKRKKVKLPTVSPSPEPVADAWSPLSMDSRLMSPRTPPPDLSPEPHRAAALRVVLANDDRRRRKEKRRRRNPDRQRHKRNKDTGGPSKEVFTSGDNILVSVSFKDQDRDGDHEIDDAQRRRRERRERRRRRKRTSVAPELEAVKPVAIIDLERSPFRELTPSPKNVIVLSDDEHGAPESGERPIVAPPPAEAAHEPQPQFQMTVVGPKTPPEPSSTQVKFTIAAKPTCVPRVANPLREEEEGAAGPNTPPEPPSSPDAYDPFEPTRSASASPALAPSPDRPSMTLEAAQKTNLSADEVLDRRPLSPMEKVMALLQSQRDVSPDPLPMDPMPAPQAEPAGDAVVPPLLAAPPATPTPATLAVPAQRIVLPSPTRSQPKLFLAKPSPIKSNPVKPMQVTKISKLPLPLPVPRRLQDDSDIEGDSPYSPGSSDFGDLFEPPAASGAGKVSGKRDTFDSLFGSKPKSRKSSAAKVPVKLNRKKGKTQVGVKIDEDNLKILDDLPSSAVEMQVKSKFLKKLNRQERVVEEVKLVLKPHYNKKRVTKDEYKDILRRAVPKICHNKSGEINPTKIQALVEAYVKKCRKKHKLGIA